MNFSHIPLDISHIPLDISHIPLDISYIPLAISCIPLTISHIALDISHIPCEILTFHSKFPPPMGNSHIPWVIPHYNTVHAHAHIELALVWHSVAWRGAKRRFAARSAARPGRAEAEGRSESLSESRKILLRHGPSSFKDC